MIQHPHCYHHGSLLFQQSLSLPLSPSVEPPHQHLLITVRQPQAFRPSYSNLVYMEGDVFYGVDLEKNGVEKAYSKLHSTPYRTPSFSFAFKSQFGVGVIVIEEEEVIIVREVDHCCCHRRRRFCLKKSIVVAVVVTPFHSECKTS